MPFLFLHQTHVQCHAFRYPHYFQKNLIYGNYRIIYRIKRGRVAILTVRHGKQELPTRELI